MVDNSKLVTPANCAGVIFGPEPAMYANSGFEAIRNETFERHPCIGHLDLRAASALLHHF
jgi:hypothetical protein